MLNRTPKYQKFIKSNRAWIILTGVKVYPQWVLQHNMRLRRHRQRQASRCSLIRSRKCHWMTSPFWTLEWQRCWRCAPKGPKNRILNIVISFNTNTTRLNQLSYLFAEWHSAAQSGRETDYFCHQSTKRQIFFKDDATKDRLHLRNTRTLISANVN